MLSHGLSLRQMRVALIVFIPLDYFCESIVKIRKDNAVHLIQKINHAKKLKWAQLSEKSWGALSGDTKELWIKADVGTIKKESQKEVGSFQTKNLMRESKVSVKKNRRFIQTTDSLQDYPLAPL